MKSILQTLLLALIFIQSALACSFVPNAFCKTFDSDQYIFHGEAIALIDDGILFEVYTHVKGDEVKDTIVIYDQQPWDCNGDHPLFADGFAPIGFEALLTVERIDTIINPWEKLGDYRVPNYWLNTSVLPVENGVATGDITEPFTAGSQSIEVDELAMKINDGTATCSIISSIENYEYYDEVLIFPNPASDYIYIQDQSPKVAISQITITNIAGTPLAKTDQDYLNITNLPQGMYIINIQRLNGIITSHKIVIVPE